MNGIARLVSSGHLDSATAQTLRENYIFLRTLESGIRLMNWTARHDFPTDGQSLKRLSYLLGSEGRFSVAAHQLPATVARVQKENRQVFQRIFSRWLDHFPQLS
ncbi:MAG: hypothetical protein D6753_16520 [Planctomycetota bacterium]|nr:MAG: hypothetical protein D6753_16520 [Planctomycetota bacterium]